MREVPEDWKGRIDWLKDQASQSYIWNAELDYWEVKGRWHFEGNPPYIPAPITERLCDSFQHAAKWCSNHPYLEKNPVMRLWPSLESPVQKRIAEFFEDHNLHNFDFFDNGGWAIVFRAQDRETGRYRIARLEANNGEMDRTRMIHPTVLPVYASNENELPVYADIKLEIMPEVVPLHKLPGRSSPGAPKSLYESYRSAVYEIARGTNLTYDSDFFDEDCENHNIGVLPDGKIVAFDTRFSYGEKAARRFKRTEIRQDLGPYVSQLYGMAPGGRFF